MVATGAASVGGGAGAEVTVTSPVTGAITGRNLYGRTGEHRRDGFLIAAGPGVSPARFDESVGLLDIAPTLCRWLGVDLTDIDGTAVERLVG